MSWQSVLNGIDAVESWLAGVSYWIQVPVLLVVLLPTVWALAGLVDRLVEKVLRPHTRREMRLAATAALSRREHLTQDAPETAEHVSGATG